MNNLMTIETQNRLPARQMPVAEVLDEYLAGQISEGTKRIYRRDICDFFEGRPPTLAELKNLSPANLVAWRNEKWVGSKDDLRFWQAI